jgi:hypothetical protein
VVDIGGLGGGAAIGVDGPRGAVGVGGPEGAVGVGELGGVVVVRVGVDGFLLGPGVAEPGVGGLEGVATQSKFGVEGMEESGLTFEEHSTE